MSDRSIRYYQIFLTNLLDYVDQDLFCMDFLFGERAVAESCIFLSRRISCTQHSIITLFFSKHAMSAHDGRALLRIAYETMLQLMYICTNDRNERTYRSERFVRYCIVENARFLGDLTKNTTRSAKRILSHGQADQIDNVLRRAEEEKAWARTKGNAFRGYWYPFDGPKKLARFLDIEDEYSLFVSQLQSSVHSTSALRFQDDADWDWVAFCSQHVMARSLLSLQGCFGPWISDAIREMLEDLARPPAEYEF